MRKILIGLFLVFAINAQAEFQNRDDLLFECETYGKLFGVADTLNTCQRLLKTMSNFWITKKDLNYSLNIQILDDDKNTTTKKEINKVKQELESALFRHFSTTPYPKKIKEVKEGKDADIYMVVYLKRFDDLGGIYVGEIDISFKATYPLVFRESFPYALDRKTEFGAFIEYFVNSIIKRTSNEIFQIANEDLPLNLNLEDYIIER